MKRAVGDLKRLSCMEGNLSSDRVLNEVTDRAMEKVDEFRGDFISGIFRNSREASDRTKAKLLENRLDKMDSRRS